MTYARNLPAGRERTELFTQALQQWAHKDPQAALGSLNELPPGHSRKELGLEGKGPLEVERTAGARGVRSGTEGRIAPGHGLGFGEVRRREQGKND